MRNLWVFKISKSILDEDHVPTRSVVEVTRTSEWRRFHRSSHVPSPPSQVPRAYQNRMWLTDTQRLSKFLGSRQLISFFETGNRNVRCSHLVRRDIHHARRIALL